MNALTVPLSAAVRARPTNQNQSFINSKLGNDEFEHIKRDFRLNEFILNAFHDLQHTTYEEDNNKLNFSSTEFIAVLLYAFNHISNEFIINIFNDDITDNLDYHINRVNISRFASVHDIYNNLLNAVGFENIYYPYLEFIKIIYNAIKNVNKRRSNAFKNPVYLKIVLMAHEFYDGYKSALEEYLNEFHDGNLNDFQLNDVDYIPYHRLKTCIIPRGQNINNMFYNFIYPDLGFYYTHQIQDFQAEEFEPMTFNDSLDQLLLNLINDCNFYIRFLPTNWIDGSATPLSLLEANNYNLHASNNTLKSILKRHGLAE